MEKAPVKDIDSPPQKSGWFNRALNLFAYPISIVAGLFYTQSLVHKESYDNLKSMGAFRDLRQHRTAQSKKLFQEIGLDVSEETLKKIKVDFVPPRIDAQKAAEFVRGHKQIDAHYDEAIAKRIKDLGYTSIRKRFLSLHDYQNKEVLLKFGTVTAMSLGALLTIANSRYLVEKVAAFLHTDQEQQR